MAVDIASGDDAAGGSVGTFDRLFPLGHAYLGHADLIGRQNVIAYSILTSANPHPKLRLKTGLHLFRRESDRDAIYNVAGGILVPASSEPGGEIAREVDLVATVEVVNGLLFELGLSHVTAGEALEQVGLDADSTFLYSQVEFRF